MDARWRAAGNESRVEVYDEAVHGFTLFPTTAAERSNASQVAFIAEMIAR
jgi:acetyl esterase/lipase